MFEQKRYEQKVEASHADQVVSVRVSSEEMVKLGTLAEEALALLAGGGSWSYSASAVLSFKRSLASLESIGCCDLSGLVRFAASINAVFSRNQLPCDRALQGSITELVSTLISWGYDPIREPLARALSAGVLLPGSGIELLIPRLLDEPKESHEFYSTVAWCVTHATLPVSAAFEPSWIATLEDRTRATAVSTAWSILRSIVKDSEPSQIEHLESLLKQPESRQVAEELMRMLYYGDEKAVEKLPVLLDLLRVRNQGQTEATSVLSNPAARFALVAGLYDQELAVFFARIAKGHALTTHELTHLIERSKGLQNAYDHAPQRVRVAWAASHIFRALEELDLEVLASDVWCQLVQIGKEVFRAEEPYTAQSEIFTSLFKIAEKQLRTDTRSPVLFQFLGRVGYETWSDAASQGEQEACEQTQDDSTYEEETAAIQCDHQAQRLFNSVERVATALSAVGLPHELQSILFVEDTLLETRWSGTAVATCLEQSGTFTRQEQIEFVQRTLQLPDVVTNLGPSLEVLQLVSNVRHIDTLSHESSEMSRIFQDRARRLEVLDFLSEHEHDPFDIPQQWTLHVDGQGPWERTLLSLQSLFGGASSAGEGVAVDPDSKHDARIRDKILFLNHFAPLLASSDLPLKQLYARLDSPDFPLFSRKTWLVSRMLSVSSDASKTDAFSLFEELVRSYDSLWQDAQAAAYLHQQLLEVQQKSESARRNRSFKIDIREEIEVFKSYFEAFGRFCSPDLYAGYGGRMPQSADRRARILDMQNEMRTRFRAIKSRVIDGTLGESDLVEPYDHILVHVAVGFDPSPDRTPEAFRVWRPKLADNDWTTLLELLGARFPNLEQILAEPRSRGSLLDRPLNPPRAEVHVDTVVRSERSEEVQQGVLATVIRIRECLVAPALAYDRELLTHNARDCILSGINDRVAQLSGVSGKGEVFVQQSLRRLDSMRNRLLSATTLAEIVDACAQPSGTCGSKLDDIVAAQIRLLGVKEVGHAIPSRLRLWFSGDYSDREQLEGCVALLEEVIRNASLELSEHGRRLWKRIFSIRELQHEVARLHALDLGDRRLSKKITLRIHEGSAFLADHAGYLCDTCLRDRNILKTHDTAQFFLFSRGEEESCRNVGGSFVFTVTTDAGEKAYMIRGFNPTQSTAMQIDVGSFFEQFVDMLAMCARHEGIRYILVPYDRYSGRAQTNRPAVMAYISDRYYKDGAEVKLTKHVPLNGMVVVQGCKIRDFGAQG